MITVILELEVQENKLQQLESMLREYLKETRKYKGFIHISILHDNATNNVVFYSQWQTLKSYEEYFNWRVQTGVMDELKKVIVNEPTITYYNGLDV